MRKLSGASLVTSLSFNQMKAAPCANSIVAISDNMIQETEREARVSQIIHREFSLLGGPLHRLGCRLGLVRQGTNTLAMGVAIGALLWILLVALVVISGDRQRLFSLSVIGAHVRLLVGIPLFFLAESWLAPRWATFVNMIAISGIVPRDELPALNSEVARTVRWKDWWLPEAVCLLTAVLLSVIAPRLSLHGATKAYDPSRATTLTAAALWYWIVCLTLFRFLILRWIWRLGLWSYFLWRVSKLKLHLVPTHPDSTAGLGYLQVVHMHFTPLVLAISAVQAASFTEEISTGTMKFEAIYPALALIVIVDAVMFLGPLFIFSRKLWACQVKGRRDYMDFAQAYVSAFDRKWLRPDSAPGEPLLGTADLQSLADLSNSVNVIRNMRWVPVGQRLLISLAIAALVPLLPLLLLKYPIAELAEKFFIRLTGL